MAGLKPARTGGRGCGSPPAPSPRRHGFRGAVLSSDAAVRGGFARKRCHATDSVAAAGRRFIYSPTPEASDAISRLPATVGGGAVGCRGGLRAESTSCTGFDGRSGSSPHVFPDSRHFRPSPTGERAASRRAAREISVRDDRSPRGVYAESGCSLAFTGRVSLAAGRGSPRESGVISWAASREALGSFSGGVAAFPRHGDFSARRPHDEAFAEGVLEGA